MILIKLKWKTCSSEECSTETVCIFSCQQQVTQVWKYVPDNDYFLSTFHPCHCHREPKWRIQLQKILEEIYGLFWKSLNCQITVKARSWHFFTNSESTSTTDQKCCSNCLFSQKMWKNCGFIVSEFVKICHELFFNKMKIWAQMYPDKCKRVRKACFLNFPCIFYIAVTNFYNFFFSYVAGM